VSGVRKMKTAEDAEDAEEKEVESEPRMTRRNHEGVPET